jgi:hypothetical protein
MPRGGEIPFALVIAGVATNFHLESVSTFAPTMCASALAKSASAPTKSDFARRSRRQRRRVSTDHVGISTDNVGINTGDVVIGTNETGREAWCFAAGMRESPSALCVRAVSATQITETTRSGDRWTG